MNVLLVPSAEIAPLDQLSGTRTLIRCENALIAWNSGKYDLLLVCGGKTHSPEFESRPAAVTMAEWFLDHGISAADIVIEDQSLDTYQNIEYSLRILTGLPGKHTITVISQWQHTLRFVITGLLAHTIWIRRIGLHYPEPNGFMLKSWVLLLYHFYDWKGTKAPAIANRDQRRKAAGQVVHL